METDALFSYPGLVEVVLFEEPPAVNGGEKPENPSVVGDGVHDSGAHDASLLADFHAGAA
jgi:hypothetical protein